MKLAVFGCSWSYGTSQHQDIKKSQPNWVRSLAKLRPDISITNFAFPGTSLGFSCLLHNQFASEFDYTVFQITAPRRFTSWPDYFDFKEYMIQYQDNLVQFNSTSAFSYIKRLNPSLVEFDLGITNGLFNGTRLPVNFTKNYYKFLPEEYLWFEYNTLITYISSKVNLLFYHIYDDEWPLQKQNTKLPAVQKILTQKQFQNYVLDEGHHFNQAGCEWQANYINDKYLQ